MREGITCHLWRQDHLEHGGVGEVDLTGLVAAAREEDGQPQTHRDKQVESPFQYLGLVTRTIPASSPEFHSKRGQEAIMTKVNDL